MRRPIIAGNWKMNKTAAEAVELAQGLERELRNTTAVDIVLCPPFTGLTAAFSILKGTNIKLGAQNVYWEENGAYTGEISCSMLKDAGCEYVIIGHSERRIYLSETNEMVNKKTQAVLRHQLIPIVCVGEKLEEREKGKTFAVISDHIENGLKNIPEEEAKKMIIAYEPVWAIGTGKTATPAQAREAHQFIRGLLKKLFTAPTANLIRIQYGGSVKPENITELMAQPDIDGALVGGASLSAASFTAIVKGGSK